MERDVVVEVREGDAVLGSDWLTNNDLVDIIELVPIFVPKNKCRMCIKKVNFYTPENIQFYSLSVFVLHERLELGTARNGEVERFRREEGLEVEQVEVVFVDEVGNELVGQTIQCRHLWQREAPATVGRAVDESRTREKRETYRHETNGKYKYRSTD